MTLELKDILGTLQAIFKQRTAELMKVGEKGVLLVVAPNSSLTDSYKITEFTSSVFDWEDDDQKVKIKQCLAHNAKKVIFFEYKTTLASVTDTISTLKFNWIIGLDADDQSDISSYAKENKKFAVVYNVAADSKYVVSVANPSAVLADGVKINNSSEITGLDLVPIIAGLCCGCPYNMSVTAYVLSELESVTLPSTISETQLTLYNEEEGVKVANPVNTLSTLNTDDTADMKNITIMEAIARIEEDFQYTFRTAWKGHYKNKYDNQTLFIAAGNGYLEQLEGLDLLDEEYDNRLFIDTDKLRQTWIASGKPAEEINAMSDLEISKLTYKKSMFLYANIKVLDAIEDCTITFNLY